MYNHNLKKKNNALRCLSIVRFSFKIWDFYVSTYCSCIKYFHTHLGNCGAYTFTKLTLTHVATGLGAGYELSCHPSCTFYWPQVSDVVISFLMLLLLFIPFFFLCLIMQYCFLLAFPSLNLCMKMTYKVLCCCVNLQNFVIFLYFMTSYCFELRRFSWVVI